ncbi:unnamed protein product [Ophioblennius macclurei]
MDSVYYKTLELNRNATDADIKRAYRRLALKFHPSRNEEPGSWEKFTQLGEAYDVLSDPRKKATYDKFGEEGLKCGIPPEHGSGGAWSTEYVYHAKPEKTFKKFFGGDNPYADFFTSDVPMQFSVRKPGAVKTQDPPIERDLHLSLDELFHGCTKKIKISRRVMNEDGHTTCIKDKILTIHVKPGWREGTRIIFTKEGDQGPNKIPADIVFIVREKSHSLFKRKHNDLIYTLKISLEMALTCFSVDVKTLDGKLFRVPINEIVHPTYEKKLVGEGMPLFEDTSRRGNLILTFEIQFPEKISYEGKKLIKKAFSLKK